MSRSLSSLVTSEQRRQLTRRSDARGLLHLAGHLLLLAVTGGLVWRLQGQPAFFVPALWLHGVALVFVFCPLHESIHTTAFKSRWINQVVAFCTGLITTLPPRYFRIFHLAHHRHTQDPERDPELAAPKPHTRAAYWWRVSGMPHWWDRLSTLPRHAMGRVTEAYIGEKDRPGIIREARLFVAIYAILAFISLFSGVDWLLWFWLVPMLMGQPMMRWFLLAEHTGCAYVPDMLRNSRTTLTNRVVRFLCWNMCFHSEHHVIAAVPFHALPSLHARLKDHIEVKGAGYWNVNAGLLAELRT